MGRIRTDKALEIVRKIKPNATIEDLKEYFSLCTEGLSEWEPNQKGKETFPELN